MYKVDAYEIAKNAGWIAALNQHYCPDCAAKLAINLVNDFDDMDAYLEIAE